MIVLVPLVCFALFCLLWPVFAGDRKPDLGKVRPLTMDEKAAWGLDRIDQAAKIHRMKSTRAHDRHRWDNNRQHAEAVRIWRIRAGFWRS